MEEVSAQIAIDSELNQYLAIVTNPKFRQLLSYELRLIREICDEYNIEIGPVNAGDILSKANKLAKWIKDKIWPPE